MTIAYLGLGAGLFFLVLLTLGHRLISVLQKRARRKRYLQFCMERGREGESATATRLEEMRGHKWILSNVFLPKNGGQTTTELDLVLILAKGIFVIENKNYSGRIYGREKDLYWSQYTGKGVSREFYNPLKQNQGHVRCLAKFLGEQGWQDVPLYSVVTFNERAKLCLKRRRFSPGSAVTYSHKAVRRIKKMIRWKRKVFSRGEMEELYLLLSDYSQVSKKVQRQHARDLGRYH